AEAVVITAPAIASGWRASASSRFTDNSLFQTVHVGDERGEVRSWPRGVLRRHRRLLCRLRLRGHRLRIDNPLLDVLGAQLGADAVERIRCLAFAGDGMARLTFLRRVDLLSFFNQCRVLR